MPMDEIPFWLALMTISYLAGTIPFGLVITKLAGLGDIRKVGSGNIGATNVLRTGKKSLAALTLFLDSFKGAALILIFLHGFGQMGTEPFGVYEFPPPSPSVLLAIGFAAILGHCFPVWLKFKGGKGVSTALGVLLAAVPYAGLAAAATWIVTLFLTRISSASALAACAAAPVVTLIIYGATPAAIVLLISLLIAYRHKENIKRLLKGEEPKVGKKKAAAKKAALLSFTVFVILIAIALILAFSPIWGCHTGIGGKHCHYQCFAVKEKCMEAFGTELCMKDTCVNFLETAKHEH